MTPKPGNYTMPFGKHKGRALDIIAMDDEGLKYLDWLYGEIDEGRTKDMLAAYLTQPTIAKDLAALVEINDE